MKPLRKAVNSLLQGNVVYKSAQVKLYDEKVFTGDTPNLYMLFGTQRETDTQGTDCTWETKSSIDILIVSKTASETSKDALDDISNTVLELLLNLPGSDNLPAQSGFQITYLVRESAVCGMMEITPTETKLAKLITLSATIIQQN